MFMLKGFQKPTTNMNIKRNEISLQCLEKTLEAGSYLRGHDSQLNLRPNNLWPKVFSRIDKLEWSLLPPSLPIFTPSVPCPIFLFLCILYVSIHFMCVRVRGGLDGGGSSWVALWCVAGTGEPVFAVCFVPAQSVANYYQAVQYLPSHIPSNTLVKKRPSWLVEK